MLLSCIKVCQEWLITSYLLGDNRIKLRKCKWSMTCLKLLYKRRPPVQQDSQLVNARNFTWNPWKPLWCSSVARGWGLWLFVICHKPLTGGDLSSIFSSNAYSNIVCEYQKKKESHSWTYDILPWFCAYIQRCPKLSAHVTRTPINVS